MSESRADLISWLNQLLQLNITKIESLGSGAAYAQVIDSIYGDVPLARIKFNANSEYQYVANFKVLQDAFRRHHIDKPIPVEGLVRCKMQDNLEFIQWLKKFWDANWPGDEYDAIGRRGGQGGAARGTTPTAPVARGSTARAPAAVKRAPVASTSAPAAARRPLNNSGGGSTVRAGSANSRASEEALNALTAKTAELNLSVEALEKERDFYFGKLREIEIIVGARLEEPDEATEQDILKKIQEILYQTEDGFEVPDEENGLVDEEETF